jgi:hypothetical protein
MSYDHHTVRDRYQAAARSREALLRGKDKFLAEWGLILLVSDLLHPLHGLTVELFLNGNAQKGRTWRRKFLLRKTDMMVFLCRDG